MTLNRKIEAARKKKRIEQAALRKQQELHAPKGAKKAFQHLKDVLRRLIDASTKRIAVLRKRKEKKRKQTRKRILDYYAWGAAHEPSIHYLQSRPMDGNNDLKRLPRSIDCSSFVTQAYKYAGAPDPNGYGYNGYGYTGTILSHCHHIPQSQAKAADLVVFGGSPGTHVVGLMEDGTKADPMCMSHGQESGPHPYPLSVQKAAHPGQTVTFCRVPGLD